MRCFAQVGDALRKIDGHNLNGLALEDANTLLKVIFFYTRERA
jgi:hypothetical protein